MAHAVAIIPARGGSKGIPQKNLTPFCGQPLLAWSIHQALEAKKVASVWVSSDSDEILEFAIDCGARAIKRPLKISGDHSSSEEAWKHACDFIELTESPIDIVVGMQATSPLRESSDIDGSIDMFISKDCDSLISCTKLEDFFLWERSDENSWKSKNYDFKNRLRRQDIVPQYLENGSLYLFTPQHLRATNNRLGGKIEVFEMAKWKAFEIDTPSDLEFCAALMKHFIIDKKRRKTGSSVQPEELFS